MKSTYSKGPYHAARAPRAMSAPSCGRMKERTLKAAMSNVTIAASHTEDAVQSVMKANRRPISALPDIREHVSTAMASRNKSKRPQSSTSTSLSRASKRRPDQFTIHMSSKQNGDCKTYTSPSSQRGDPRSMHRSAFISTASVNDSRQGARQSSDCVPVPHFVQLETLMAGQVFVSTTAQEYTLLETFRI